MDRREFIRQAALISAGTMVVLGRGLWTGSAVAMPRTVARSRLVVIFLRGAVDGLSVVAPHGDPRYFEARPTIALPRPGGRNALHDLDGYFGLHPALEPLIPLWNNRSLAFVHACGSPNPTRSHFEAQGYIETATPGHATTPDGWMNRLLAELPGNHDATEALNLGPTLPKILAGRMPVANLPIGRAASRPLPIDRPGIEQAFARLYGGSDPLGQAFREGEASRRQLLSELDRDMRAADAGAPNPNSFAANASQLAHLIDRDPNIRLAFVGLGGWDTHVNQGAAHGQLANHLQQLAQGLSTFTEALGPTYNHTVIVVISEFGRTVLENGNGGTDHGHGNVIWLMGGPVRGGRVYGDWPGLSEGALYQGRDLAATTDFRQPLASIVQAHLGLDAAQIRRVLPDSPAPGDRLQSLIG